MNATQILKKVADQIDALSIRERGIIFVTLLAVLFFLASNTLFASLRAEQDKLEREVNAKLAQVRAMQERIDQLIAGHEQDPDVANRARLAELQKQLQASGGVSELTTGVVAPKEIAGLLRQMLTKNKGLQLINMENLPATPLAGDAKVVLPGGLEGGSSATQLYKHGMHVQLKGQYLDIVRYLRALEDMPKKVFWGEIKLETEQYPISRVTFVVYTLGLEEAWIGI